MQNSAGGRAADRAAELQQRRIELAAGHHVTQEDVELAGWRAEQSRQRAKDAHQSSADRHEEAAHLHEHIAEVHHRAALNGLGDATEHHTKERGHLQAADADRAAADQARDRAEEERH